ncbi:S8 family peptidase [Saccharothrix obliqua]|uniref:S8 family peptidase n=1 Tax=Saccharothrix obliqua TaxID=2861747 RepID=UPI001C5D4A63|nr:S8 family serine peptidase [Saccharothrix obliqua]MBW4717655.1 S8 family serine peptidase [Saccharothrix obliqua]
MGDTRLIRRTAVLGLAAVSAAALAFGNAGVAAAEGQVLSADSPDAIAGSYIVALRDSASPRALSASAADSLVTRYGGQVRATWQDALNGFHAQLTAQQARRIAADPRVDFVQADLKIQVEGTQTNPPSWGLDRIDQPNLPLDNSYTYPNTASNVRAYVVDTGIRTSHQEFGGRATWGTNTIDSNNTDCHGHGTHVAGTVGSRSYGVAKEVKLVAVKVLDCQGSGSSSSVVNGVNWVARNAVKPAVGNMSLGGPADSATDTAVRGAVAAGITFAVASGNDNKTACNYSPARVREAISTNASNRSDQKASFSNWGTCTDIFAPGQDITSTWHSSDSATNTISGTSMASPHVAGAAAIYVSANPSATPAQVETALVNAATNGKISNPGTGSPNKLLFIENTPQPTDPKITNPGNQSTNVGQAVNLTVSATEGTPPYTFSFTGLPTGLTGSASGQVTGAPTTAGTYTVTATVTDAAGKKASVTFTWTVKSPGGCDAVTNDTDVAIGDNSDVNSPITLDCTGAASATTQVTVNIVHTYIADLVVDLVAPDGTVYNLHNRTGGSADNISKTFTVDASAKQAAGQWKLRVRDAAYMDTGRIDSWTLDA